MLFETPPCSLPFTLSLVGPPTTGVRRTRKQLQKLREKTENYDLKLTFPFKCIHLANFNLGFQGQVSPHFRPENAAERRQTPSARTSRYHTETN